MCVKLYLYLLPYIRAKIKNRCNQTMESHSALKRHELLSHEKAQRKLKFM